MATKYFSTDDILERILLVLPSKFNKDDSTDIYKFFKGMAAVFKIDFDLLDEFFLNTNLVSATGEYVDEFISELAKIGRKEGESDEDYKQRYYNLIFKYNCSQEGIQSIVLDLMGKTPQLMYAGGRRGAYTDAKYYYDNDDFTNLYGADSDEAFKGFIKFGRKPNKMILDEMVEYIRLVKAAGVKVYLVYPPENDLEIDTDEEFEEGTSERVVIS